MNRNPLCPKFISNKQVFRKITDSNFQGFTVHMDNPKKRTVCTIGNIFICYLSDKTHIHTHKRVWSGNTTITYCRPTHGTTRKSHRTIAVIGRQAGNQDKAQHQYECKTIEGYKSLHNKTGTKHRTPTSNGGNNKQSINNNRPTALERTAV